ncbi:MAG: NAD(P)H-hydrate epimerase [Egibacteraceae bacterium]
MDAWSRIRGALDREPPPFRGRVGAALALLSEAGGELELVYTRRREDLTNHPGQISFPGGRVEPGERVEEAAVREAVEEVGLDPATVTVLGTLEAFYIPPSRFWLATVVARWDRPHPLVPAEAEVAEVLHVSYATLVDPAAWRVVRLLSRGGWFWAWQLDDRHLLWGATAVATAALLDLLDPDWRGGVTVSDLVGASEVRPWEREAQRAPRPGPPRLRNVPEVPVDAWVFVEPADRPEPDRIAAAGAAVATAAAELAGDHGRVLVLAGTGGTGAVALAAASLLRERELEVRVVLTAGLASPSAAGRDEALSTFTGTLPEADMVVDGLVGAGLSGPLRNPALAIVHALRLHTVPILSIDVPCGLDPVDGLVGDVVPADVTVALGRPREGLFLPGLSPYVGDLYVADLRDAQLVRLVPGGLRRD